MDSLAIIGYAVRYPQDASDSAKFWDFLLNARESSTPFPDDRINAKAFYHPDPDHGGTFHAKRAHFLQETPVAFDAAFFKMSKTEVLSLDPQHRLVMENVYHALENAGIPMSDAISSNTSVFVNGYNHDHADNLNSDPETILKYKPTGTENAMISGRLSWFYDFRGPSVTVETACSGSLVGLHLAGQSLKTNESDMAIVSGVNVIGFLPHMVGMSYSGFMGSEGKCFAFDHRADGYARGEGVGTVIVKRLSRAVDDGDTIRAIIRGTGLNQDGRTPGITYPSLAAQERLIEKTYQAAGLDTADTCFIESHGTGTQAGDYVEASAISSAFKTRTRERPLYIGALKTNIGHLEGGSGMAGLIKTIIILETGIIPPNANFEKANPKIPIHEWKLSLPTRCEVWPTPGLRRASVSCFGLSGTNSHCILDDAYNFLRTHGISARHKTRVGVASEDEIFLLQEENKSPNGLISADNREQDREAFSPTSEKPSILPSEDIVRMGGAQMPSALSPTLLVLSGFDPASLSKVRSDLATYIQMKGPLSPKDERNLLLDLSFTLTQKRTRFSWRTCFVVDSIRQLQDRLADDSLQPNHSRAQPRLGFVFTGQGAQYARMGQQLLAYPVFRQSIEAAETYFRSLGGGWRLSEELSRDRGSTNIDEPAVAHPSSTAIQIALVELLASWGIFPTRVVGHSSGEIAAAYCAGKISRQAAWKIAFFRGQVASGSIARPGAMVAVGLGVQELQPYLDEIQQRDPEGVLTIACFNSPKNQTVSGDSEMVDSLKALLDAKRIFARKLNLGKAYHSEHMKVFTETYQTSMGSLDQGSVGHQDQSITMFSTFTGEKIVDSSLDASYWCANMVGSVRFEQALRALCFSSSSIVDGDEMGETLSQVDELIEIGAHGALQSAIKETTDVVNPIPYHPTLDRGSSDARGVLQTVANLAAKGYPVDIYAVHHVEIQHRDPGLLVDLPPYPFSHENKDIYESRLAKNLRLRPYPRHDIFGAPVADWNPRYPKWRQFLRLHENPWLRQHTIDGQYVFPPAGYIAMAIESALQISDPQQSMKGIHLEQIAVGALLKIPEDSQGIELSVSHSPIDDISIRTRCQISSYDAGEDQWTEHCSAYISLEYDENSDSIDSGFVDESNSTKWEERLSRQKSRCQVPVQFEDMCKGLASAGLELGPLYQSQSDVTVSGRGCGTSISRIEVPDIASTMPKNHMHSHLLHPVTLHNLILSALAAIYDVQKDSSDRQIFLPSLIERVWVSTKLSYGLKTQFQCIGTALATGRDSYMCNIEAAVHSSPCQPAISLNGVHLGHYKSNDQSSQVEALPQFYSLQWRPDIHLLSNSFFDKPTQQTAVNQMTYDSERQWFTDLQLASTLLSTDALFSLKGANLTELEPHYLRFYDLLQHIAADMLTDSIPRVPFKVWQQYAHDPHLKEALYRKVAARDSDGALLIRVGSKIASFFRQEVDPLYIMFGQDDLMSQYYKSDFEIGTIPEKLAHFLDLFRWNKSNLRVLEVGGGTGSFTAHALAHLCPPNTEGSVLEYVFTDISPSFFEKAKESLRNWNDIMTYKRLDVGSDPLTQGFEPGTFDLIVASNVLHATPDLHLTLKNIHCLLKPGGKLAFHEGVRQDTMWTNLSFSALSGWWLSTEPERRWCPYVPTQTWDKYLRESGFSGLDLDFPSSECPEFSKISLMVSTARGSSEDLPTDMEGTAIVVVDEESSPLAHEFESQMKQLGLRCSMHTLAEVKSVDISHNTCVIFMESKPLTLNDSSTNSYRHIQDILTSNNVLLVTGDPVKDPAFDLLVELIRNARFQQDSENKNLVTISVADAELKADISKSIMSVLKHQFASPAVSTIRNAEYRLEKGVILTNRITPNIDAKRTIQSRLLAPQPVAVEWNTLTRPVKLVGHGRLSWETDHLLSNHLLGDNDVDIEVRAVGLGSRDLLVASGKLPETTLGEEASGVVTAVGSAVKDIQPGDRVMCLSDTQAGREGALRTAIRVDSSLVMRMSEDLSFEAAAELPVSWLTAVYSIHYTAKLTAGEKILIHNAVSSIGQAAIQYARFIGAEVLATVSDIDEKEYIAKEYQLPHDHIFSSSPTSFPYRIKQKVPGGVDVIISHSSPETIRGSLKCIASFGRLVEISHGGTQPAHSFFTSGDADNISIAKVDLRSLARNRPKVIEQVFQDMMQLVTANNIRPQPSTQILTYSQIPRGIEMMQEASAGKIILHPSQDPVPVIPEIPDPSRLNGDASYLLIGTLDPLQCQLALHLAGRGAKNLILLSRLPVSDLESTQSQMLNHVRDEGCHVHLHHCDNIQESELQTLVARWHDQLPPIKGIITSTSHANTANEAATLEATDSSDDATTELLWLHHTFASVDFFIMISSIMGLTGEKNSSTSQETSAFQDALARHRVASGLHAASINLGDMKDEEVLAAIDYMTDYRDSSSPDSSHLVGNLPTPAAYQAAQQPVPSSLSYPLFHQLPYSRSREVTKPMETQKRASVGDLLSQTSNAEQATAVVSGEIRRKLSHLLNITEDEICDTDDVRTNGVDSLIEMEFRSWLDQELRLAVSLEDLTSKSISKLSAHVVMGSPLVSFS